MSTHAAEGTRVLNDSTNRSARQPSDLKESLKRQLAGLLDATMRETWLPMGFRVLVVQEFPAMRRALEQKRNGLNLLENYVSLLLEEGEPYKAFAGRSAALLSLRDLKAELTSRRVAA